MAQQMRNRVHGFVQAGRNHVFMACLVLVLSFMGADVWAKEKRPVALVEALINAPEAEVQSFDYAYHKDKIDLRPNGQVVLAYFDSCIVETVTGGLVKMTKDGSKISKGGQSSKVTRACRTAELALSKEAKEAGASVKRVSPFSGEGWNEWALNTGQPLFKWPKDKGTDKAFTFQIYYLDAPAKQLVWQTSVMEDAAPFIDYPSNAPALTPGMPYEAVATFSKKKYHAVFSVDPNLVLPAGPANRLVPLTEQKD